MELSREAVRRIDELIRPYVRRTPVIDVEARDFGLGDGRLNFKLELMQHSGSFKARGAFANLLTRDVPPAGVVAASGGNHGAAVAYAAHTLGVPARIYVPTVASAAKLALIRSYGAELVVQGDRYADALAAAEAWAAASGAMKVHAYDEPGAILGQATVAAEWGDAKPDTVLVAVGGGGLIGGIALWWQNSVRVIGVEPEAAPTLTRALAAGRPVDAPAGGIAADSLAPRRVGELMFPIAQKFVDRVLLVDDEAIRGAQRALWRVLRVVAEPGGAAAFAALLSGKYQPGRGERVGVLVCGGNTTAVNLES